MLSAFKKLSSLLQKLNIASLNISHTTLKYKLQEHYQNKIHEQLKNISKSDCGKLAFYSKIVNQNEYKLQHYLRLPLKKCDRSLLTKLRISAHPLYIETGRYSKPPLPKKNVFAVHVDCLLKMKNILYYIVQSMNNTDGSIMIYLMLTHILVMIQ